MKVSLQAGTKVRFTNQSTSMYIGDRLIPLYGGVSASFAVPADIYIITEQSDGKVILGGNFLYYKDVYSPYIVRILPNGEPDPDFNVGTGFNGIPQSIIQQQDGKILAGGSFTSYSGSSVNRIVRLNPSGTIDPDFKIGAGFSGTVYSIYKQLDNKIVAAGQFTTYSGSALNNIVRINLSGSVDSDFSIGTGLNTTAYSVYQQSDGKILVGGEFISASGVPSPRIARYNISGGLDLDFATGSGFNTRINSIIQQSDNKIVAVGTFTTYSGSTYNRVIRLNLSGGIDPDFSIGTGASSEVTKVIQQSDGKLIIIGIFGNYNFGSTIRIARINTSGSQDTTFSVSGLGGGQTALDIIQKSDGTILMGGEFTTINGSTAGKYDGIIQLNDSGSISNANFYGGVRTSTTLYSAIEESTVIPPVYGLATGSFAYPGNVIALATQSDGKILIAGVFQFYKDRVFNGIARLNSNYEPDPDFNPGLGVNGRILSIIQQSDGKILAGGSFTSYSGSSVNRIVRLNPNGTIDPDFKIGAGFSGTVYSIYKQLDNKILVGGDFTTYSGSTATRIVRLNSSGSIDPDFSVSFNATVNSILQQPDTKILIGGNRSPSGGRITRLNLSGSLDLDFISGSFDGGGVTKINLQPDGKILAGGTFTTYSGSTANYLARINPSGSIDTDFSPGGVGLSSWVFSIDVQSDGKILAGGTFSTFNSVGGTAPKIIRINPSGSLDTTFKVGTGLSYSSVKGYAVSCDSIIQLQNGKILVGGSFERYSGSAEGLYDGIVEVNDTGNISTPNFYGGLRRVSSDTLQPSITTVSYGIKQTDGKYVFAGNFLRYQKSGYYTNLYHNIIRLNSKLEPDPDFNPGAGPSTTNNSTSFKLYQQSDKKLLLIGDFTSYSGSTRNRLVRINPSGSIDPDFNIGTGFNSDTYAVYQQSDGKLLIGSAATTYSGSSVNRIVRLNPSGTIDTDFNTGNGADSTILTIYKQSDNKILLGGFFTTYSGSAVGRGIVRVYDSGTIDPDFNQTGSGFSSAISTITQQSDGKILVGGDSNIYSGSIIYKIVRLNLSGSLDTTFKSGTGFSEANGQVNSIVQQSDNKILVGGTFTTYSGSTANNITRLNISGNIDATFNTGSYVNIINQTFTNRQVRNILLNSDNTIDLFGNIVYYSGSVIGGYVELNPSGSIANVEVTSSSLVPNGKVLLGGNFSRLQKSPYTASYRYITRLLNNGNVDPDFKTGVGFNNSVFFIKQQLDGKILVGGFFQEYSGSIRNRIVRLNLSGSIDPDFTTGVGFDTSVYSIYQQSDGKILAGGDFTTYSGSTVNRIVRLNPSGTIDPDFTTGSGLNNTVYSVYQQTDGKILVGGNFTTASGVPSPRIVRYNLSGSIDSDFISGSGFNDFVKTLYQQSDNKILVGGRFTTYSGSATQYIIRLNTSGNIDTDFKIGVGTNSTLNSIYQQSDGKILAGGDFTTYSGSTVNRIVRINPSGSIDSDFKIGAGFNSSVQSIVQQLNGNILVAGDFTSYSGSNYLGGFAGLTPSGSIATYTTPSSYLDPLTLK